MHFSISILALLCAFPPVAGQTTSDCLVPADPDIYGLGVRLGLYFQILSNILLAFTHPDEAAESLLPTQLFFVSFFSAVVYSAAVNDYPPGGQIACTWFPILLLPSIMFFNWRRLSETLQLGMRIIFTALILLASLTFNIWFWFKGIYAANSHQCIEPRVFFFANLPATGRVGTLFRIFTIAAPIVYLWICIPTLQMILVFAALECLTSAMKRIGLFGGDLNPLDAPEEQHTSPVKTPSHQTPSGDKAPESVDIAKLESGLVNDRSNIPSSGRTPSKVSQLENADIAIQNAGAEQTRPTVQRAESRPPLTSSRSGSSLRPTQSDFRQGILALVCLSFYILVSELQLHLNHLSGIDAVNSTGQMMPLVLGAVNLLRSSIILLLDGR